jgi:hypothetical protein
MTRCSAISFAHKDLVGGSAIAATTIAATAAPAVGTSPTAAPGFLASGARPVGVVGANKPVRGVESDDTATMATGYFQQQQQVIGGMPPLVARKSADSLLQQQSLNPLASDFSVGGKGLLVSEGFPSKPFPSSSSGSSLSSLLLATGATKPGTGSGGFGYSFAQFGATPPPPQQQQHHIADPSRPSTDVATLLYQQHANNDDLTAASAGVPNAAVLRRLCDDTYVPTQVWPAEPRLDAPFINAAVEQLLAFGGSTTVSKLRGFLRNRVSATDNLKSVPLKAMLAAYPQYFVVQSNYVTLVQNTSTTGNGGVLSTSTSNVGNNGKVN